MGKISKEEIAGIWDDVGNVVCADCVPDEVWTYMTEDQIISRDNVDNGDDLYFCDECREQL